MTYKIAVVESKGTYIHSSSKVLQSIDDWYIKEGDNIMNKIYYGVGANKKTDLAKYKFLKAFDNIICRDMSCDLEVTSDLLEAVSIYTKNSQFKMIK